MGYHSFTKDISQFPASRIESIVYTVVAFSSDSNLCWARVEKNVRLFPSFRLSPISRTSYILHQRFSELLVTVKPTDSPSTFSVAYLLFSLAGMEKWRRVEVVGCVETVKELGAAFKKKSFSFFLYSSHRGRVELLESRLKELRPFDFRSFACPILWNSFTLARTVLWDIPFVRCLGFQPCEYIYIRACFVDPFTARWWRVLKNRMEEFFVTFVAFITFISNLYWKYRGWINWNNRKL